MESILKPSVHIFITLQRPLDNRRVQRQYPDWGESLMMLSVFFFFNAPGVIYVFQSGKLDTDDFLSCPYDVVQGFFVLRCTVPHQTVIAYVRKLSIAHL